MPDATKKVAVALMVERKFQRRGRVGFVDNYEITGTRHAYYLLRKLAQREWFVSATLLTLISTSEKHDVTEVYFSRDDILNESSKFTSLLDRRNTAYDLTK